MQASDPTTDPAGTLVMHFLDIEAAVANDEEVAGEVQNEGDPEPDPRFTQSTTVKCKGRPASKVWQYFKKVDSSKDSAGICLLYLRDGITVEKKRPESSTRDMWKHLADFHNIDRYGKMVKDSKGVDAAVPY